MPKSQSATGAALVEGTTTLARRSAYKMRIWEVIAGEDNRAAIRIIGPQTTGDSSSSGILGSGTLFFLFTVAFTYNTGRTWTTVDAALRTRRQLCCRTHESLPQILHL